MIQVPEFITLGQAIEFNNEFGARIKERAAAIEAMEKPMRRDMELLTFEIEQAYWMASVVDNRTPAELMDTVSVPEILRLYHRQLLPLFAIQGEVFATTFWAGHTWRLPPVELKPDSKMVFGEFIDSKIMVQDVIEREGSRWEMLLYVAAIFLRQEDEVYDPTFLFEGSQRLSMLHELPLPVAASIGKWFDQFTEYLQEYFPVFSESQVKSGHHISMHMNQWGWVNFLKSIAVTKVFDVASSGLNSIECARLAKAYDVLVSASEEKQYNEAVSLDMEAAYKK